MRRMIRRVAVLSALVTVAGCDESIHPPSVSMSVAQQALGVGALSVYPFATTQISAPGIYSITLRNGIEAYNPVCTSSASKLRALTPDPSASDRPLSDFVDGAAVSVATPFVTLSPQYALQTVNGFETEVFSAPSHSMDGVETEYEDTADWILANVHEDCRNKVLSRLDYYVVVVGVARSPSIRSEIIGGVELQPFDIGVAGVTITQMGRVRQVSQSRVFAISGKLFREGAVTTHGPH